MARPKAGTAKPSDDAVKILVRNRRALHDYAIEDRIEAGIALMGSEVKSLRDQRASLSEGYVAVRGGEAWLVGVQINEYPWAHQQNHAPTRERKLLLHRREIESLIGKVQQQGLTLVPIRLYFKNGRAKLELALARGKEQRDKRRDIAKRDAQREIERALRRRR